ncbi:hypothetical protein SAMD00019534_027260 [Acytostelium subglobosum LB1]|uniref:hypothetical protein n=1 Tax=Acytostelium subglobosum LB1 TaxID=1410327 RepID=UPI0006449E06|nr:hypothetical protein SAMD00019534_027260 [Acytostelium subglobosum LB1]GAM19551.1 hypothetical protein SAMD00019534_027260 [Acytostelium subglobosum LB1]|eukprot:XP_012757478.1 hypothetical protein SAMD00019534_027260 [Acytostelium subglobosum LB1]
MNPAFSNILKRGILVNSATSVAFRGVVNRPATSRLFCTATKNPSDIASRHQDFSIILKSANATKLRQRLSLDPRTKIPYDEFKALCVSAGFQESEVERLSSALTESGNILHLPTSTAPTLSGSVFIKPNHVYQSLYHILDIENKGVGLERLIEIKNNEIKVIEDSLRPLEAIKLTIDGKAMRGAHRVIWGGLGYLVLQGVFLGRLTWWELSWDIVEPITYFVSFGTVLLGYTYFSITKTEYTFEALRNHLFKGKQAKLFKRQSFPIEEYNRLHALLAKRQQELAQLTEISSYSLNTIDYPFDVQATNTTASVQTAESQPKA